MLDYRVDSDTEHMIEAILNVLPPSGETHFPDHTYEQGIKDVLLFLWGVLPDSVFEYDPRK